MKSLIRTLAVGVIAASCYVGQAYADTIISPLDSLNLLSTPKANKVILSTVLCDASGGRFAPSHPNQQNFFCTVAVVGCRRRLLVTTSG
ncbi:MAG: hypothetical protein RM022_025795 [Nostoc sp. EfeVER01]|uniref:hypothetical protein n=1 Tax=Nostoc sp. EfeVER01 TaxID=3075406 RepID=UPI002AD57297|nr:hypothetical protein [Nostoc sp. EfeVER01]MDZ7945651.1 hypothetical protein [Nostoc sp. EfeVER01]